METMRKSSWHGPKQIGIMIYCLLMFAFGSCLITGQSNTVFPWIAEARGWSVDTLRLVGGIGSLVTAFGVIFFAKLCEKKGPKFANTISMLATSVVLVVFGLTKNYYLFCAMVICYCFLASCFFMAGNSALTANWWPTKKGIVLGVTTIGVMACDILWGPFMPEAFNKYGFSACMIAVAIALAVLAIVGAVATKGTPEEAGEYPDGDMENAAQIQETVKALREYKSDWTLGRLLKDRGLWGISIGMGIIWLANLTYVCSIVPRLLSCGYEYSFATKVLLVSGCFACIGSYLLGVLDQKAGTKKACILFGILLAVTSIIARFHAVSLASVWISSALFFGANGAVMNLVPSACASRFGRWDFSAAYTVIGFITALASGIGILLVGVFHDYQLMYTFDLILYIVGILVLVFVMDLKLVGKKG